MTTPAGTSQTSSRIHRVRRGLARAGTDAVLFLKPANLFYLTGFRGSDGALLVFENDVLLLVDGRYKTQAQEQAAGLAIEVYQEKSLGILEACRARGARRLSFKASAMAYDFFLRLSSERPKVELSPAGSWLSTLRAQKDSEELARIRQACSICAHAGNEILSRITTGMTEREIALELEICIKKGGAEDIAFPPLVASGERTAWPHAKPSCRTLRSGDILFFDFGCRFEGYHSDETVTRVLGTATKDFLKWHQVVQEAQNRALEAIRPGVRAGDVDEIARSFMATKGLSEYFSHSLGHGIGLEVHEHPRISGTSDDVLEEGMVFSIEPGIYVPGRGGVRIEDVVAVTAGGVEVFTTVDKRLHSL